MHNRAMATASRLPVRQRPPTNARPISLAGLRGFEAAARLLSFTLAAQELHLTTSTGPSPSCAA